LGIAEPALRKEIQYWRPNTSNSQNGWCNLRIVVSYVYETIYSGKKRFQVVGSSTFALNSVNQ